MTTVIEQINAKLDGILKIMNEDESFEGFKAILKSGINEWTIGIFLLIVIAFVILYLKWDKLERRITSAKLLVVAGLIFLCGVVVYTTGALQNETMGFSDALYTIPSALISSLGMFIYQDDISELSEAAKRNSIFMAFYSITHLLAAMVTAVVVLRLIFLRAHYFIKVMLETGKARFLRHKTKNLYLFWGINPRSVSLAESIFKESRKHDSMIFFVDTVIEDSEEEENFHVNRLFDLIKIKREAELRLKAINALMASCHYDMANCLKAGEHDLFTLLGKDMELSSLATLIKKTHALHIFFLSNDEDNNINSLENAIKAVEATPAFMENKSEQKKVHLYCHARHSAKTRWAEIKDIRNYGKNPRIHIVDSSYLSIFSLKDDVADHPISFVDIDKQTATVTSPFRSMVIGFGETGQEALKFLYEFGAFVDKDGNKTKFHCTVIDKKASELDGLFYAKAPAMKERSDEGETERELCFKQCPVDSRDYWNIVESEIRKGLNYIVIAIDNEEIAINAAINICSQATIWKEDDDPRRLKVYVRSYNNENIERLECIEQEMKGKFGDLISLHVFGSIAKIFRYEIVVDNKYVNAAKKYHEAYNKCIDSDDTWENLFDLKENTIWEIEDAERMRDQNISNALHAETKRELLVKARTIIDYWKSLNLYREKKPIPQSDKEYATPNYTFVTSEDDRKILENLARLEHERWIAASLLQGQQLTESHENDDNAKKFKKKHKRHTDLVPWGNLRNWYPEDEDNEDKEKTQAYDCAVVDTTISLS